MRDGALLVLQPSQGAHAACLRVAMHAALMSSAPPAFLHAMLPAEDEPGPSSNSPESPGAGRGQSRAGRGGRGGRGGGRDSGSKEGQRKQKRSSQSYNVVLDESDELYVPALTDEDLDQDPPGHRSGYVAVIGKPNAGARKNSSSRSDDSNASCALMEEAAICSDGGDPLHP